MKLIAALMALGLFSSCEVRHPQTNAHQKELQDFISKLENKIIPLSRENNLSYFTASVSGKQEDYQKWEELNKKQTQIFTDKESFQKLDELKMAHKIKDPLMKRQLDLLWAEYKKKQAAPDKIEKIIQMETEVEKKFATYRANVQGKQLTDNQIEDILMNSTDAKELQSAWEGSKKVGQVVAQEVIALVKLRNEIAREAGYENFHQMQLSLNEQAPQEIEKLFNELDALTKDSFQELKKEIDQFLAKKHHITIEQLRPWHYQNRFFQEAPKIYSVDLDQFYQQQDVIKLASTFYQQVGLSVDDILTRSDLYEKEGKQQHAYCTSIDRDGDVRIFENVKPSNRWMSTTLHELGHAVYSKHASLTKNPWFLREESHIFTTEAIAMLMGRLSSNAAWIKRFVGISEEEANKIQEDSFKALRLEQLVFSRWSQVMYRFEKALYQNPDQDLNALWWDLVARYQGLKKPEGRSAPDWASKIHVATVPCYYHNYHLGELLASQLNHYIVKNILNSTNFKSPDYAQTQEVGSFLKEKVFKPGKLYPWNEMIKRATGEVLTAKYYAAQFID